MIKNFEELAQLQAACTAALSDKFSGKGEKRAIVLCGGTGCLSSNSAEIKEKIDELLVEKGLTESFLQHRRMLRFLLTGSFRKDLSRGYSLPSC